MTLVQDGFPWNQRSPALLVAYLVRGIMLLSNAVGSTATIGYTLSFDRNGFSVDTKRSVKFRRARVNTTLSDDAACFPLQSSGERCCVHKLP